MIMIYGPAGAGKSTQGQLLAEKLGRKWLSAGQIIRDSGRFEEFTKQGKMIDEKLLVDLISEQVRQATNEGKNVVFDGQPGTAQQVKYLKESGLLGEVELVIRLEAPENVLRERLMQRGRADDNDAVWREKFDYFEQKIYTFLHLLEVEKVPILVIDGVGTTEEVLQRILFGIRSLR